MLSKRTLSDYGSAVIGLWMIYEMIRPRKLTSVQVIEAVNNSFAQSIRAAMGDAVIQDLRTSAEKFHEEAMRAIGSFWKGFTQDDD